MRMRREKRRFGIAVVAAALLLSFGQAQAADIAGATSAAKSKGTMALMPGEWAQKISDEDMKDLRGGFFGFSLSFLLTGFFDNVTHRRKPDGQHRGNRVGAAD